MKRRLALFSLPILLGFLLLVVKWRAEHPTPTQEDLAIRAHLSKSYAINLVFSHPMRRRFDRNSIQLSHEEFKPFIASFCSIATPIKINGLFVQNNEALIDFICFFKNPDENEPTALNIDIAVDQHEGELAMFGRNNTRRINMHPATVKRWVELLLTNPRFGSRLRARLN